MNRDYLDDRWVRLDLFICEVAGCSNHARWKFWGKRAKYPRYYCAEHAPGKGCPAETEEHTR